MMCFNPLSLPERGLVPCGKCIACLKRRQDDWCFRLEHEFKNSTNCFFITLTYEDKFIPKYQDTPILRKRDFQLFFKRLRKRISPSKIRYFACGEYGSRTRRPHYHVIIFNYPEGREVVDDVEKAWTLGFSLVKPIHHAHFRYVAKYCVTTDGLPPLLRRKEYRPFTLCSRRPAIGACYLTSQMVNYHRSTLSTRSRLNGYNYATPKYYRDRMFDDDMKAAIRENVDKYLSLSMGKLMDMDVKESLVYHSTQLERKQEFERIYKDKLFKSHKI